MDAEQDEEKEDDGEEPQSDSHKQDPAVRRMFPVGAAGNQCPMEQPYYLQTEETRLASKTRV